MLAVGLVGGTLAVALQSHDLYAPPLVVALLVVADAARRCSGRLAVGFAIAALGTMGLHIAHDALGVVDHARLSRSEADLWPVSMTAPGAAVRFFGAPHTTPPPVSSVIDGRVDLDAFNAKNNPTNADLALLLQEGVRALDAHAPPDARVFSVLFSAPFPYLRGTPAPLHTLSWYHAGRTYAGESKLDPTVFLSDVDVVLFPKLDPDFYEVRAMWGMLGVAVERDFHPVETTLWTVWIRNTPLPR